MIISAPAAAPAHAGHPHPSSNGGGGHGDHHTPGKVFPGQPPAWVLPPSVGPGVTQPADVPDTAKGDPLPHWDGVLLGSAATLQRGGTTLENLYVNGAFNYMDHVGDAKSAVEHLQELTAGPDRPAAVLWRDKFGIFHGQALLSFGGFDLRSGQPITASNPVAAHLGDSITSVNLGHPEALAIIDGDHVFGTAVQDVVPIPDNGAQWKEPAFPV